MGITVVSVELFIHNNNFLIEIGNHHSSFLERPYSPVRGCRFYEVRIRSGIHEQEGLGRGLDGKRKRP